MLNYIIMNTKKDVVVKWFYIPINVLEIMNGQEIMGEVQTENRVVDIGPLRSFEGRWPTPNCPLSFQGSDSRISAQRVCKQTNAFSKDYIVFRRMRYVSRRQE